MNSQRDVSQPWTATVGTWTVVLALPFDDQSNHTPSDAIARLQQLEEPADTVVWQPSHLSAKARRELGMLVMLDHLLAGDRFNDAARQLSAVDREQARALLQNQRSQLQQRLRSCLEAAYGISVEPRDALDNPLQPTDHLQSLDGAFQPGVPSGATLGQALRQLLDQMLAYQYPAHPQFEDDIKPLVLRKVFEVLQQAIEDPDHRVLVTDKGTRHHVAAIANPLKLGSMGATHFVLGDHWPAHFHRLHAQQGGALTVKQLRAWSDEPKPMGLTREVQNLIILTFADQTNRSLFQGNVAIRPGLESIADELELREQSLPELEDWEAARTRAARLFGLTPGRVRNAANLGRLVDELHAKAKEARQPLASVAHAVEARLREYGVDPDAADRLITVRSAQALLAEIEAAEGGGVVEALARADIRSSDAAMERTLTRAKELESELRGFDWESLEALGRLADHRREAAQLIRARVAEILATDEHATALAPALSQERAKALRLLTDVVVPPSPPPPPSPPDGEEVVANEERRDLASVEATALLLELAERVEAEPECRLTISWRLTRRGTGR